MKSLPQPLDVDVSKESLIALGQGVINSIADAQRDGCAACLRKSDDYVVVVGSVFDLRKSANAEFQFSALCGECFNVACDFGRTKRG